MWSFLSVYVPTVTCKSIQPPHPLALYPIPLQSEIKKEFGEVL